MSNGTSEEELCACWRVEYARPFVGWDYTANVLAAMECAWCMLGMDTGGGEKVADLPCLGARAYGTVKQYTARIGRPFTPIKGSLNEAINY